MFGGWLPWMTQGYMGALKSQLLIPVFALVDAVPAAETLDRSIPDPKRPTTRTMDDNPNRP